MRWIFGIALALAFPLFAMAQTPDTEDEVQIQDDAGLARWISAFRPRAMAAGITPATFDAAFAGVHYNASVVDKDRNQIGRAHV